jgi:hypothetical protein
MICLIANPCVAAEHAAGSIFTTSDAVDAGRALDFAPTHLHYYDRSLPSRLRNLSWATQPLTAAEPPRRHPHDARIQCARNQ